MLRTTCPAATPVHPPNRAPSVICGVLALDHQEDRDPDGKRETRDWHILSADRDPATIRDACCGRYDTCLIWRTEKKRLAAEKAALKDVA